MKVVINAVDRAGTVEQFADPDASPSASYTSRSGDLTAVYKVPWSTHLTTVANLLPQRSAPGFLSGTANTYKLKYSLGHKYFGAASGYPNLRCYKVDVNPFGKSGSAGQSSGGIGWTHAVLTASYRTEPTIHLAHLYEESMDPAFETSTMPARALWWDAGGTTNKVQPDEAPTRLQPLLRWSYTIRGMPSLPTDMKSYQGFINTSEMTSPTYNLTFPAGTVLFRAPHIIPSISMMGDRMFDVTMEFVGKMEGATTDTWNKVYKAGTQGLQPIYKAAGGGLFEQFSNANLNDLLLALAT